MNARRLSNVLLSGLVTRYHAVPSVRPQTTGQHQWGVAILMIYLTEQAVDNVTLIEGLIHDSAELYTGDVPFTVKRDHLAVKTAFDQLENQYRETDLFPPVELLTFQTALLKLCDTLEGLIWCAQYEQRMGPVGPRWVEAYTRCKKKFGELLEQAYPGIWERADQLAEGYLPCELNTTNTP